MPPSSGLLASGTKVARNPDFSLVWERQPLGQVARAVGYQLPGSDLSKEGGGWARSEQRASEGEVVSRCPRREGP